MPIGPSHSGRSSGGFGGSRSGGGHSYGGGGYRSHSFYHGPRRFVFFGRTYVLTSGASSIIALLLFGVFFFGVLCFGMFADKKGTKHDIASYQTQIATMESDAEFYTDLIQKATSPTPTAGYYLATATIDNNPFDESPFSTFEYYSSNPTTPGAYYSFRDDQAIWYFVVYKYTHSTDGTPLTLRGMTYTQYSYSQLPATGELQIAYTYYENNWWSINTDYTLAKNKDYTYTKELLTKAEKSISSKTTWMIISGIVVVGLVVGLIFTIKKNAKRQEEENQIKLNKAKAETDEAVAKATEAQKRAAQIGRKCEYCESSVPDGAKHCPNCGSSMFD